MRPQLIVERARGLVGSRFRPQGRDSQTGLDCVGLILAVYEIAPGSVPRDYRLRGDHLETVTSELARYFTRRTASGIGDLLLCRIARDQLHLAISCGDSFVHADAGIGRVVETPGDPQWPVLSAYRRRSRPVRKA